MKKINWQYAAGEILLIFIGITLAIGFQNWNENRKQAQLEQTVLKQLQTSLQKDLKDVNNNIGTHTRALNSCQHILQSIDDSKPINGKKLVEGIADALDNTFLVSDVSTYEYLRSIGLHIIQNDSLRQQISTLYEVVYKGIYGVENNSVYLENDIISSIKKYYTVTDNKIAIRNSLKGLKKDHDLKFEIKNLELLHYIMIGKYKNKVLPALNDLIVMVDEELQSQQAPLF